MKKIYSCLLTMLFCLVLPIWAMAASNGVLFTVTQQEAESANAVQRVQVYTDSNKANYLFLPAGWDASALRVWTTQKKLIINGETIRSGDVVSMLTPGETVRVQTSSKGKGSQLTVYQADQVPSVFMTTKSGSLKKIHAKKSNEETGELVILQKNGTVECEQPLTQVRGHGNSSFKTFTKKSYQFKLENKQNLFGMGKSKTWLLLSNQRDHSHLRNMITSVMSDYVGLPYAPQMLHANLYVNGEYRGLYLLTEKIQVASSRVAIDDLEKATQAVNELPLKNSRLVGKNVAVQTKRGMGKYYQITNNPEDISGGYLMELERYVEPFSKDGTAYRTLRDMFVYLHTPKYCSEKQYRYISGLMQSLENALFAADGKDKGTGKHYSELIDVNSMVLKLTLEQVVKNYDANRTSQYYYKPADEVSTLIYAGPVWDYDSSYGCYAISKHPDSTKPTGFYVTNGKGLVDMEKRYWYPAMYRHAEIREAVQQAYAEKFRDVLCMLLGEKQDPLKRVLSLDEYAKDIAVSAAMDSIRWPYTTIAPNIAKTGTNLQESVDFLKNWIIQRRAFLDGEWMPKHE